MSRSYRSTLAVVVLVAGFAGSSPLSVPIGGQGPTRTEWFVAPDGSPSNDGSSTRPLDLASGLDGKRIPPGSTVWLTGGTYRGPVTSTLAGTATAPIVVRQAPGQRAIVTDGRARADGATLAIKGAWTTYRDFEVTNLSAERGHASAFRPMGFEVQAPNTKFINLVVYDTGMGFGFWKEAIDAELYGNIIFNSGSENTAIDSRHGHGIYTQNDSGTKLIRENILVDQYGFGIHAYPNPGGQVGFRFEGNVIADSGAANPSGPARYSNILVAGYKPYRADRIELVENYTYLSPRAGLRGVFGDANVCLGCTDPQPNGQIVVRGNYFAGGAPVAIVAGWQRVVLRGNTLVGTDGFAIVRPSDAATLKSWDWNDNDYAGSGEAASPNVLFAIDRKPLTRVQWLEATGFDATSRFHTGRPSGTKIFVRPNAFERGRGHVVIYNWDRAPRVSVDLNSVLNHGDRFEIRNAFDYFGAPVATGSFDGAMVSIPLGNLPVAQPRGGRATAAGTKGEFGVFVVRVTTDATTTAAPAPGPAIPRESSPPRAVPLSALAGRYTSETPRGDIRVRLENGVLKAAFFNEPGRPVLVLKPVAPFRFALEGTPFFAEFRVVGGAVQSLIVERGAAGTVTLYPQ